MKKFLVLVDMQKDFVDGSLGTKEAVAIVPKVIEKIRSFDGELFVTYDTHFEDYLETAEGKKLPVPHCIYGTPGWELADGVRETVEELPHIKVQKYTFGSTTLPHLMNAVAVGEHGYLRGGERPAAEGPLPGSAALRGRRLLRRGHARAA